MKIEKCTKCPLGEHVFIGCEKKFLGGHSNPKMAKPGKDCPFVIAEMLPLRKFAKDLSEIDAADYKDHSTEFYEAMQRFRELMGKENE